MLQSSKSEVHNLFGPRAAVNILNALEG